MTNFRTYIAVCLLALGCALPVAAQRVAVKTNLLYDATTTPNLGLEAALGRKHTVQLFYGLNPWELKEGKQMKHWLLMSEYRYWLCEKFNGHFFGVHLMGGEFNAGGIELPGGLFKSLKDNRYEGWYAGGGITYGYQWMLSRHWNFEGSVGLGYDHIKYRQYPCVECGALKKRGRSNYFGPTKLALSLIYVF